MGSSDPIRTPGPRWGDQRMGVARAQGGSEAEPRKRGRRPFDLAGERERDGRRHILDTAQRLLERTGSATIRDIEYEARMARGTIYRHFESRDHIVAALQLRWLDELQRTFQCESTTTFERLLAVIAATVDALSFDQQVARSTLEARQSASAGVFETCSELDRRVSVFLSEVLAGAEPAAQQIAVPFRLAWYGAMTQWAQGLLTLDEMEGELAQAAHLFANAALNEHALPPRQPECHGS